MTTTQDLDKAIQLIRTAHEALEFARPHIPEDMWVTINTGASYEIEHLLCALIEKRRTQNIEESA
tara:strand:+ start:554 stop:748 length:195 start_codon:yes stop_codon:yes gene_type:complete